MTDKENIKALECLAGFALKCIECPYSPRYQFPLCQRRVAKEALDLIDRQQAEIEKLTIENQSLRMAANSYKSHYNEAKVEAIREFAERLNDRIINFPSAYPIENATLAFLNGSSHRQLEILEIVYNLAKEMAGDTNENLG